VPSHFASASDIGRSLERPLPARILISSGASCPDALVEAVIRKLAGYYGAAQKLDTLVAELTAS
jgi:4-hydroxy-3-methylbut-2-enyl diphosphate reductase